MTKREGKAGFIDVKGLLRRDEDFLRSAVEGLVHAALEAEMTEAVGAAKSERTERRLGYRSGYYERSLVTRVGTLELRVPQDRAGRFSTELFERYQRSEKALVAALAEMYVQGVSTRKVKAVTEELCGHEFSASSISAINKKLDESLKAFSERRLEEAFPYVILDARYERIREAGVIASQAVLIAVAVDWEGRRQVRAIELANRESRSSWKDFLLALKRRGLSGVEYAVSDDPERPGILNWMLAGLKDYLAGGLRPPTVVCQATKEYQREMNTVGQWIEAMCEKSHIGARLYLSEIHEKYAKWSTAEHGWAASKKKLAEELRARGYEEDHPRNLTRFTLRLRPDEGDDAG